MKSFIGNADDKTNPKMSLLHSEDYDLQDVFQLKELLRGLRQIKERSLLIKEEVSSLERNFE